MIKPDGSRLGVGATVIVLQVFALYALAGVVTAAAFVTFGATRVLPQPGSMTVGARLLVLPGAALLWPYVLLRWLRSRGPR